jgi:hypothetical protein
MAKTYFHVFFRKIDQRHAPPKGWGWQHEASADTKLDADDYRDGLKRDGYRVKIVRSADDPLVLLAKLNA